MQCITCCGADEFDAYRALDLGFVRVVAKGSQIDRAKELADELCQCAPIALQEIKRAANIYLEKGESEGFLEIERMRAKT